MPNFGNKLINVVETIANVVGLGDFIGRLYNEITGEYDVNQLLTEVMKRTRSGSITASKIAQIESLISSIPYNNWGAASGLVTKYLRQLQQARNDAVQAYDQAKAAQTAAQETVSNMNSLSRSERSEDKGSLGSEYLQRAQDFEKTAAQKYEEANKIISEVM